MLVSGFIDEFWQIVEAVEVSDHFECVTLVDEELLAFSTVEHFLSVFGDEGVEEGIEAFVVSTLGSKNTS